ncbi:MAG: methyltransferase domain-containing protein, partial [Alphaproteobacteria bacterium]
ILDLGCGDGALSERLVALGGEVVGVDASAEQVAAARRRGLDARVMDAAALCFEAEFDAVFSNAALHWMHPPAAVIAGVWRALKPGGRFVAEMGGHGNVARIVAALETALHRRGIDPAAANPWYFPTPQAYRALLQGQGFVVEAMDLIPRPTPLPGAMEDWLATFAESFIKRVPAPARRDYVGEVTEALRPDLCDPDGRWTADYVRLRFRARRPA